MTTIGVSIAFGTQEPKPTRGFPDGKLRLRIRSCKPVIARVKTAESIREFAVKEQDGFWIPAFETARNMQAPDAPSHASGRSAAEDR